MPRESNRSNKGKHSRYADEEEDTVGPNKHAKHCARVDSASTLTDDAAANNKSAAAPTQDVAVPPIETNNDGSSTNAADESAALITTTLALNPSNNTLAHNRPTNNNNNNEPESTAAALSAVVDEEVDVRVPLPAAAAAAGDEDVDTPGDTNAVVVPLPQETVPSYDPKQLDEMFRAEFFIGRWFDSSEEAELEVKDWQRRHYCKFRKEARGAKCSNSSNTNSRKKASGEKTMTTKPFALSCSCPAEVRWSNKKKDNGRVQITYVNGLLTSLMLLQHNGSVEEISRASFPISELLLLLTSKGGRNQILRQPVKLSKLILELGWNLIASLSLPLLQLSASMSILMNSKAFLRLIVTVC